MVTARRAVAVRAPASAAATGTVRWAGPAVAVADERRPAATVATAAAAAAAAASRSPARPSARLYMYMYMCVAMVVLCSVAAAVVAVQSVRCDGWAGLGWVGRREAVEPPFFPLGAGPTEESQTRGVKTRQHCNHGARWCTRRWVRRRRARGGGMGGTARHGTVTARLHSATSQRPNVPQTLPAHVATRHFYIQQACTHSEHHSNGIVCRSINHSSIRRS